jgi:hypothetical protein
MKPNDSQMHSHFGSYICGKVVNVQSLGWKGKKHQICRNPSLGLATKARACKVVSQERKPGSERKCEGMNPHTPKGAPTLGVGVPMDFRMFKKQFQGSKPNGLRSFLYHWKDIETILFKMGSHDPFGHLKHKLWWKEGPGIKLTFWLPTTKSQELTRFHCLQVTCDIPLKSSQRGLQLCFRPHLNRRSTCKVMRPQSFWSPNFGNLGVSGQKCHLDVGLGIKYTIRGKVVASLKSGS